MQDVSDRWERMVAGSGQDSVVVVHVGTNDMERARPVDLVNRYRALLKKMRESGRKCVLSGILPRVGSSAEWDARALRMNSEVQDMCEEAGVLFMDGWDMFYGRRELFARDGLHLSRRGMESFSDLLEGFVRATCQGN